ncbi:MAG: SoxY-related AACIE arm protein [Loktanella sp.]|nr:SoxY-related AACIE arm protein [Loktanella sp.]
MTLSRRTALTALLSLPLVLQTRAALATPESMQAALDDFTGGAPVTPGRVTLKIPLLVENGNSVPLSVSVDSPMTAEDHVEQIAIFNEINPLPDTARFHLGPRSGLAAVETRIRLNGSQTVHAVARMTDGSFWSATTDVIVTAPACREV